MHRRHDLPATILVADWSRRPGGRAVWRADVAARRIGPVERAHWDLGGLLDEAARVPGPVLLAMDLVLGVPRGYWRAARRRARWRGARTFLDLLARVPPEDEFWGTSPRADAWHPGRPFYAVPAGEGALTAFDTRAGYPLRRPVDRRCGSQPPLCVSGIPGTVGSGTRALWRELAPRLREPRDFAVWPFEGRLHALLAGTGVVLAELYPALAYAVALLAELPGHRLHVGKTRARERDVALDCLLGSPWLALHGVAIDDVPRARGSEDDFDALLGAAGLLRRVLDGGPLDDPALDDHVAEGGILLTCAVDLDRPGRRLSSLVRRT